MKIKTKQIEKGACQQKIFVYMSPHGKTIKNKKPRENSEAFTELLK